MSLILARVLIGTTLLSLLSTAGAGLYAWHTTGKSEIALGEKDNRIEQLTVNRNSWKAAADRWQADALRYEQERTAARQAAQALALKQDELERRYAPIKKAIEQSRPQDDGPVAPVLRQAIEALP